MDSCDPARWDRTGRRARRKPQLHAEHKEWRAILQRGGAFSSGATLCTDTRIRTRHPFVRWLAILCALHAIVVCAGLFAPYDPIEQDRKNPYLPPMGLHLMDAQGHLHLRPFAYALKIREGTFDQYEQDLSQPVAMKFFKSGAGYRLFGFLPSRKH